VESSDVASPGRGEEPELQVVAEPLERMSDVIVAENEEDVWVEPVAKQEVAESRVALVDEEQEVGLMRLLKGKKKRLAVGGESDKSGDKAEVMTVILVEEDREVSVGSWRPWLELLRERCVIPVGLRLVDKPRARGWNGVRREYRFVDRSFIGVRNGMVRDSYHARGGSTRAQVSGGFKGGHLERCNRYRYYGY